MASLAPTQPEAHALPSLSHHRPCTYSGFAQSLKPGPVVVWSCWPRFRAVVPCGAAASRTQQPTSVSTLTRGAGVGAGAEPHAPSGLTGRPPTRRTGLRPSDGPLSSHVCSVDCRCLGTGVRSWATSVSLRISLYGHLCQLFCVCVWSLWGHIESVLPDRDRLQKEQNRRLRKTVLLSHEIFVSVPSPLPWVLTTDESEAPGLMRAAD